MIARTSPENRTLMHAITEIGRQAYILSRYDRASASGARRDPLSRSDITAKPAQEPTTRPRLAA